MFPLSRLRERAGWGPAGSTSHFEPAVSCGASPPPAFVAPHPDSGYLSAHAIDRLPARNRHQRPHGRWHDLARAPTGALYPRRV